MDITTEKLQTHNMQPIELLEILNEGGTLCFSGIIDSDNKSTVQVSVHENDSCMHVLASQSVQDSFIWSVCFADKEVSK